MIDFYATWRDLCHQLAPIFDAAAESHAGRFRFGRWDVDDNPEVAGNLSMLSVPTIVVFDPSGREVDRLIGAAGARHLDAFLDASVPRVA